MAAVEGEELIGKPAPPFRPSAWVQGRPEEREFRGKVVLLRWWTQGCSLCRNTAPALDRMAADFGSKGLLVVGVYHPKPPRHESPASIRAAAQTLGLRFPVAVDEDWSVLKRWWLDGGDRRFTSVSFLLDRDGRVRYVHPGGEYFPSEKPEEARQSADYRGLRGLIEKLLAERS